jgi:tripartite-type tricarboxylate transporter receptor subunit TctC
MLTRRRFVSLGVTAALAALLPRRPAHAQSWPARHVRLVIGFPGALEVVARLLADRLTALWGQQVVVDPKLGAGGNLAAEAVARSNADGYTMLLAATPLAVNRFLFGSLTYDALTDFAPVSLVALQPNVMLVPSSSPAHSVAEFVAYARANPGKIIFESAGAGTSVHLCGELFKRTTGIEMTHVPNRTAPLNELAAGRADVAFPLLAAGFPLMKGGRARALAVSAAKRLAVVPELPTFAEAGFPGMDEVAAWNGLFVPAGTTADIVAKVHADTSTALADPLLRERLANLGITPVGSTPARLGAHLRDEIERWGPIVKDAKIGIDG